MARHNPTYEQFADEHKVAHTKDGTIKERLAAPIKRDEFFIDEDQRKEYGIADHEDVYWARDARQWGKIEGRDRIKQIKREADGRLIVDGVGDAVTHGEDLVLMAIPKARIEERDRALLDANREYEAELYPSAEDDMAVESHKETFDRLDTEALYKKARLEHQMNVKTGMVGGASPTKGLSLSAAAAVVKRLGIDVEGRQAELRRGGQHTQMDHQQFQEMMLKSAGVDRKTFGVGNVKFGRDYQQELRSRDNARQQQQGRQGGNR